MGMSKIMDADTLQSGTGRNCSPRPIEISPRLVLFLRKNDILALSVEAAQNGECRGVEYDGFPACIAIRQKEEPALKIHVLPFEVKNLAKASAGEDQQPECGGGVGVDFDGPVFGFG